MGYAIRKNTIEFRAVSSSNDIDVDEVFIDQLPGHPIWDNVLQNVREKTTDELFLDYKLNKIGELKLACKAAIESGFTSNALGSAHIYESKIENQLNIVGAALAGKATQKYTCTDVATGTQARRTHNTAQMNTVFSDGVAYKDAQLDKLDTKIQQVLSATTEAEVNGVTW